MLYLNNLGLLCALGAGTADVRLALLTRDAPVPDPLASMQAVDGHFVAPVKGPLPQISGTLARYSCRNNALAAAALEQIRPALDGAIECYGSGRIAVVMGTSTSGIVESEKAVKSVLDKGEYPQGYHAIQGVLGGLGEFVSAYLNTSGPVTTVSTACSSSANAILSARRLLNLDLCDAVVVGGVDSLCALTLRGFGSLEALAGQYCTPFALGRDGINIGEAAAIFLMSRTPGAVSFLGGAASSDAHHISAPHPEGSGAYTAMNEALINAGLHYDEIDYLNVHGTATKQNDAMESKAIHRLFGANTPCSSTKSMTGHTLGASGALELALCWLLLTQGSNWRLPPSLYTTDRDPDLAQICLTGTNDYTVEAPSRCMSNSFAFGGSNVSLIVGANHG